jgi:hypothetical protein
MSDGDRTVGASDYLALALVTAVPVLVAAVFLNPGIAVTVVSGVCDPAVEMTATPSDAPPEGATVYPELGELPQEMGPDARIAVSTGVYRACDHRPAYSTLVDMGGVGVDEPFYVRVDGDWYEFRVTTFERR